MESIKIIRNKRIISYLAKNKVYPLEQYEDCAIYWRSTQLSSLLEKYTIESYLIPNKL